MLIIFTDYLTAINSGTVINNLVTKKSPNILRAKSHKNLRSQLN